MILTFVNNKGGVGKTTSVQNTGAYLAKKHKVLLVDMDPQANLTKVFGLKPKEYKGESIGEVLLQEHGISDVKLEGDLDLVPASHHLEQVSGVLTQQAMFHTRLKKALKGHPYNYVLIDCPPSLGPLTTCAMYASQMYFVPMQAEYLSYEGLARLLEYVGEISEENDTQLGGVFPTRYNPKARGQGRHYLVDLAREQLGDKFMDTFVRENIALMEAQGTGKTIFEYDPESNGAQDYAAVAEDIVKRTGVKA